MSHRIPVTVQPEIAFISIGTEDFQTDARWQSLIDLLARHGPYNTLTVSMRCQGHPLVAPETRALFARLVDRARARGLGVALDLDPRLARAEFRRRWPDELQRVVYVQRCRVAADGSARGTVHPESWQDHMTWGGTPYRVEAGRCVRALAWRVAGDGLVVPGSQRDVSTAMVVEDEGPAGVAVRATGLRGADEVVVLAEFTLFTPDVFSPHLISYQQELLELYADLPLVGVVKDEWGFPPTVASMLEHRSFWYSPGYAAAYAGATGGRDLLADLPLLAVPVAGREAERVAAIAAYNTLNLRRQAEIETAYYEGVKKVFGAAALVTKHATWYPRINGMEVCKNGLSWWAARRDIAQTDEITPLSAALGMAKKFGAAIWLNEGYAERPEWYRRNIWRYALAGGRMVFHPLFPTIAGQHPDPDDPRHPTHSRLLTAELIRAEGRVRLLGFISRAPLDCPVAFVFGHERVANWAGGGFLDYGEELSLDLWRHGYAVDLYPSSEIVAGTFAVDADGWLRVGCQQYEAMILYGPDLCPPAVAEFFQGRAALRTAGVVIGPWARDDRGRPWDGLARLPADWRRLDLRADALPLLLAELERRRVPRQPPLAEPYLLFGSTQIGMPAPAGLCRLVDGTVVRVAATWVSDGGDPIRESIEIGGLTFAVQAEGLFAARVDDRGRIAALAAGGLRRVAAGSFRLELPEPLDLALWRQADDGWAGVVQGLADDAPLPPALQRLTDAWLRLSLPPAYPSQQTSG